MATFGRSLAFLLLLVLLFLLGTAFRAEVPSETVGSPLCQCSEYTNDGYVCENQTCHTVECYFIDTPEEVDCVEVFLNNVSSNRAFFPFNVQLLDSNFDVFPDDFLLPYNVLALVLNSNTMPEVPYRLINPVCPDLLELTVFYGNISTINASGFQNCNKLLKLDLSTNGITAISPDAFVGLTNLQELVVFNNALHTFDGLQGVRNLTTLDLSLNKISSVSKEAFQELNLLEHIDLSRNNISTLEEGIFAPLENSPISINLADNPLNCNCSLEWLQEWAIENGKDTSAYCTSSQQGLLVDADFSKCSAYVVRKSMRDIMASGLATMLVVMYASSS